MGKNPTKKGEQDARKCEQCKGVSFRKVQPQSWTKKYEAYWVCMTCNTPWKFPDWEGYDDNKKETDV